MLKRILTLVPIGLGGGIVALWRRYDRDIASAQNRLDKLARHTIPTPWGTHEYADVGDGPPVLVSHGIFHGCDGGLVAVAGLFPDRRVIVPSRFGYLGTTLPEDASSARQADAFAELLDHLGIQTVDAVGISAGTGAAVQLALRHPDRVGHLIISSGNLPGSPTATAPPAWAKAFYTQPAMWSLKALTPQFMRGLMGVPGGFPHTEDHARQIDTMIDSVFPLTPRKAGAIFDAYQSNPEIDDLPLADLAVPTLVIHAVDDPLASYEAAARAVDVMPNARLATLESGGHLQLGQTGVVAAAIAEFLGTRTHAARA